MMGYTDRVTRCRGSRSRIECSSTPAPSSGYMFWIAPIQMPIIPVRRSPKYFQVSESGPSGSADLVEVAVISASCAQLRLLALTITLTTHVVYDFVERRGRVLSTLDARVATP